MPISSCNTTLPTKKLTFNVTGKSATAHAEAVQSKSQFLTIAPALPILPGAPIPQKLVNRSYSSLGCTGSTYNTEDAEIGSGNIVALQQAGEGGTVVATRSSAERDKNPDRICLDRRGLTTFPNVVGEPKLRLMSLQHNLISKIETANFTQLTKLVFLDLYDNQIEKLCNLNPLENLRVLLIGKNRLKKIEGLKNLSKLEVLDFHGNKIAHISGLEALGLLKVLNLAGNNIKGTIGNNDFQGLVSLKELNLRRNNIKKLLGFGDMPQLQKLYLSNNDIQKIEDMGSLAEVRQIKEITIDGNPVTLNPDCVSFLVSYLPNLQILSTMKINEQLRRTAMAWRTAKEHSNPAFLDLSTQVCVNVRREEVICNAKTNWELLQSQSKCFTNSSSKTNTIKNDRVRSLQLQNSKQFETVKLKSLDKAKSKGFGSLSSINENIEAKKMHFKKRCNSINNIDSINDIDRANALEFKLPPILVPIINNMANSGIKNGIKVGMDLADTDVEISDTSDAESFESLKDGIKSHLIKSNIRALPKNCDTNVMNKKFRDLTRAFASLRCEDLSESVKKKNNMVFRYNQDGFSNGFMKSVVNQFKMDSSSSKTSSLDSSKSVLSDSSGSSMILSDKSLKRVKSAQLKKVVHYRSNRAATARAKHRHISVPSPPPQPSPPKEREQGGDYLIEIVGRCLNVYGHGSLRFVDRAWDFSKANDVNIVKFHYVQFNGIATILNKLKHRFPNAEHFIFKETNISHLGQLNALAEVQGLSSIQIDAEGNPIVAKNWKIYAIFRLAHWGLKFINGLEITQEDIEFANQEYSGLSDIVMWSLPESLLQPLLQRLHLERLQKQNGEQITAKQFLFSSDPTLRNVVAKEALQWRRGQVTQEDLIWRHKGKVHLSHLIDQTVSAIEKLQILEKDWQSILCQIVYDTLKDYSEMDSYMKRCSKNLDSEK